MDRIVTSGSVWVFDPGGRYYRTPRIEGPREDPDWGAHPGADQDYIWHEFTGVRVIPGAVLPLLNIQCGEEGYIVTGPIVEGLEVAEAYAAAWPIEEK